MAAFGYVLVLVIVALLVPLALNLSRRVDAEIRSEARGQAQLLAAFSLGPARRARRARAARARAPGSDLRGRVIIVGPRGRLLADSEGEGLRVHLLRVAARGRRRAARRPEPGRAPQRHAARGPPVHRGAGRQRGPHRGRRARHPERRRRQLRGAQGHDRPGRRGRDRRCCSGSGWPGCWPARWRGRCAGWRRPRAGSPAAISTRAHAWRGRRSSARWRRPSTT